MSMQIGSDLQRQKALEVVPVGATDVIFRSTTEVSAILKPIVSMLRSMTIASVCAIAVAASAGAHQFRFSAPLTGAGEAALNDSPGTGYALVTLDEDEITMHVQTSFSGLMGQVTSANIFAVTGERLAGTGIAVVQDASTEVPTVTLPDFPTGDTFGDYDRTINLRLDSSYNPDFVAAYGGPDPQFQIGTALVALIDALNAGKAYLNIITTEFPDGEVRGFPVYVPGDYNNNGVVDAADYTIWRDTLGQTGEGLDADFDNSNSIDEVDYVAWRDHFGQNRFTAGSGSCSAAAVAEPSSLVLALLAAGLALLLCRWRFS
jgi:hypothetical protein